MELTDEAQDLVGLMREISEVAYCAGWMSGLEYDLWRIVLEGPQNYGRADVTEQTIHRLKRLSERCGGWIHYHDATEETLVPHEEWLELYDRKMARFGGFEFTLRTVEE